MHLWGDDWFKQYGDEFYKAIDDLEYRIRKWSKAFVYGKEKFGRYEDSYLTLWDGGLFQIIFGYKMFFHGRLERLVHKIDHSLIPVRKTKFGWFKVGLCGINWKIGLTQVVRRWQEKRINKAFQITCKEHPDLIDELVSHVDCWEFIKPCKWGDVDGTAIHNKYWERIC